MSNLVPHQSPASTTSIGGKLALNVNIAGGGGSGGTASNFGAAFPATGTAAGASDGTNMQPLLVDGSGNLKIAGSFSATPVYSHTVNAGGLITVTTDALLLAQNLSRVGYSIQNISTTAIYILEGVGTCSATNFSYVLPAGGTSMDGSSPYHYDTQWQGPVRFCAASGTGKVAYEERV